jgi:hypothetical protein
MAGMRICQVVVACAAASLVTAVSARADVQATLTTSSKVPKVGEAWHWTINAHDGATPARISVRLQILRAGAVIGCYKDAAMAECKGARAGDLIGFTGKRTGVIRWPERTVGVPLTFQVVVITKIGTVRLRAPVRVEAASAA